MEKKELTLQDLLENMQNMYTGVCSSIDMLTFRLNKVLENNEQQPEVKGSFTTEILNTAYVTLTEDGCFVGGEPATQYNGEDIYRPYLCVAYFKEARDIIREEYGYELLELHCLQSSTKGEWAKSGNPVPDKKGINAWVRGVYKDKEGKKAASLWVFYHTDSSASECAGYCANDCGNNVRYGSDVRSGVFGSVRNDVNEGEQQ